MIEGELEMTIDGVAQIARPGLVAIVPRQCPPLGQGSHRWPGHYRGLSGAARFHSQGKQVVRCSLAETAGKRGSGVRSQQALTIRDESTQTHIEVR